MAIGWFQRTLSCVVEWTCWEDVPLMCVGTLTLSGCQREIIQKVQPSLPLEDMFITSLEHQKINFSGLRPGDAGNIAQFYFKAHRKAMLLASWVSAQITSRGLLSFHNHINWLIDQSLLLYLHVSDWFCFSGDPWLIHGKAWRKPAAISQHRLNWGPLLQCTQSLASCYTVS